MKNTIAQTKQLLIDAVREELHKVKEIAVAFSGSLDSALVAYLIKKHCACSISLYTVGFRDCYDFKVSKQSAQLLDLPVTYITLNEKVLEKSLKDYMQVTSDTDKVSISYSLPLFMLLGHIQESTVATGHGADTLFGGFFKYLSSNNLKRDIKENYQEFLDNLAKREYKMAQHFNKKLVLPFANKALAQYVQSLSETVFIQKAERKYLLREVARSLGLPEEIIRRPKKAIQYSSGVVKRLKGVKKRHL